MCVYIYIYICIYLSIYLSIYVYIYIYICMHALTHRYTHVLYYLHRYVNIICCPEVMVLYFLPMLSFIPLVIFGGVPFRGLRHSYPCPFPRQFVRRTFSWKKWVQSEVCRTLFGGVTFREDPTANLPTKMLDFIGFCSSIFLILGGGILMSMGNFPESLSQQILAGKFLAGRLGRIGGFPKWVSPD